jgi:mannose-binding lectin 2
MNAAKSLLIFATLLASLNVSLSQHDLNDFLKREHSLIKPYGGGTGVPNWDFVGSTIVTNKFIRLTADSQSLVGALWNTIV